jgi:HTH-type transcriptional regulator/antitoxin HigA
LQAQPAPMLELHSLSELPDLLIKARIARGYTQAELARRLKLKSQQIQRYEATRYRSVNFECLLKIAQALDVDLQESRVAVSAGKNVNHAENTSREGL